MSSSSTLIAEAFGHVVLSCIRGATEHYNPRESEYISESFGYSPLESTGQEWYLHGDPDDEFIYQEYSNREATSLDHRTRLNSPGIIVIDASSMEENDETQEYDDENEEMARKRLRPSFLRTVLKSMYTGASISLLTATIIGSVYMLICYLSFKTVNNCEFYKKELIPVKVQWAAEINFCCNRYCFPVPFVLCMHAISISSTSNKRSQTKNDPGYLHRMVLGHNLSSDSTSSGNISFQAFYFAETSSPCFLFWEFV